MGLWDMSVSGGIFIVAIIVFRSLFRKRLSVKVFQLLWVAAFLRLMLPFSIPFPFSIYSLADRVDGMQEAAYVETDWEEDAYAYAEPMLEGAVRAGAGRDICFIWIFVYLVGAVLTAVYHICSYVKWYLEFQTSLPVTNPAVQAWASALPLRRRVSVRQWERLAAPLTYGIIRPVILLPKALAAEDSGQLPFVLAHEYMHIRQFDAWKKLLLVLLCCVHWFNPMVWAMCVLANRDMELACDRHVIEYLGEDMRSMYALALIDLEEQRGTCMSWGNCFCRNAIEERVVAIMREKKKSVAIGVLSGVATAGLIMAFATSSYALGRAEEKVIFQADEIAEQDSDGKTFASEETAYAVDKAGSVHGTDTNEGIVYTIDDVTYESDIEGSVNRDVINEEVAYAVEGGDVSTVPKEYASCGIAVDLKTGSWMYKGKKVAAFYDKEEGRLMMDGASGKKAVYLEVCRDKEGNIEKINQLSKKEMQELLASQGLVF